MDDTCIAKEDFYLAITEECHIVFKSVIGDNIQELP